MADELSKAKSQMRADDKTETVVLKDGRTLAYGRYGETQHYTKLPVFYCNGTPGSHPECGLLDEHARKLEVLLIGIDRPGFGDSTWQDDRTLLHWPSDVLELADHLDIAKFGVISLSGGGPHALACLQSIPRDRLVAVTVISGMWPMSLGNAGMMWQTRLLFGLAGWSTWVLEKAMDLTMGSMLRDDDRSKVIEMVKKQNDSSPVPQVDKDVMTEICQDDGLIGAYLGSSQRALRTSSKAAAWELWILGARWDFELENLDGSRLTIWHGSEDVNVPVGMPDKAVPMITGVKYNRVQNQGHVSLIVKHGDEILSELIERLR